MKKLIFIVIITVLISCVTSRRAVRSQIYYKSSYKTIIDSIRDYDNIIIPPLDSLLCSQYFSSDSTVYTEYLYHKTTDTANYILVIGKGSDDSVYVIKYRVE